MTKKYSKPRLIKPKNDDPHYEFLDFLGYIEGKDVIFTINIAPDSLDRQYRKNIDKLIKDIDNYLILYALIKKLIKYFDYYLRAEGDFYWREEDLNLRITIPLSHPKLPKK